jgi:hypothetical protein
VKGEVSFCEVSLGVILSARRANFGTGFHVKDEVSFVEVSLGGSACEFWHCVSREE